jgi:transposase-like protein
MARSKKEAGFWSAVVAEAKAGTESLAAVAAKHGVTEAALRYHFYQREKPTEVTNKPVPMLPVRVEGAARLFSIDMDGSLRLRFAEGCDPAYVAAVIAKLR